MDEIYLGRARGVITNLEDHTLVDMLPDRKKETITRFLQGLEHQEKIRKKYRDGHGHSFEALRAKVLFSDQLQKRARIQEKVKVKRKRFDDVSDGIMRLSFGRMPAYEQEYDIIDSAQ